MRVIIAGSRDYTPTSEELALLDKIDITEVVSGTCRGVDRAGEDWARSRNIPIKQFPAQWDEHGRAAGPIRNEQMAKYADAVVLFHSDKSNSRGTASMYRIALKHGLIIYDYRRG